MTLKDKFPGGLYPRRPGVIMEGLSWNADRWELPVQLTADDFAPLRPGESLRRTLDPSVLVWDGLPPGRYQIRVLWRCFESGSRLGVKDPPPVVGLIKSESVFLEVPPQ